MVCFSKDVDILKCEPVLFGELHLPWQVLVSGTGGALSGTTFSANDADFVSARVSAGQVVYLRSADGLLDGAYEVVSVDSATQLTVSVLRAGSEGDAVAPPGATDISYRISTFEPQTNEAGLTLTEYFSIKPGDPASEIDVEDVLNAEVLKRASVFAVVSSVYAMLASKAADEHFWKKSLYYKRLFQRARERCRLSIDVDGDGLAEVIKVGSSVRLARD